MAGLVADSHIALSSLRDICDNLNTKNVFREGLSVEVGNEYHDLLCIAMETKFQYLSFERGKQVAVLDIAVADRSITDNDSGLEYHSILRLYGSAAFSASTGLSRVTRGTVIFLSQCCSKPNRKGQTTNKTTELRGEKNETDLNEEVVGSNHQSKMMRVLILKLHPVMGSLRRLIVDDSDCAVQGFCRGAYPKLYGLADYLSQWSKSCPSIFLSRMVPASSVYVPRLRAAFGFSCIDIVLQYTVDEDDIRRFNAQLGETKAEDISHCKRGEEGNLCSADAESKNRITCQRSALSGDRIARADCGNINSTAICATALVGPDRFGGVSLKMIDCDGVSVKFESIDRNLHDTILAKIIEVYNKTKSNTVQIFFKTICVKSSFANQITCLLATEMTEYVILRHPNVTPHEGSTESQSQSHSVRRETSWAELKAICTSHTLLKEHTGMLKVVRGTLLHVSFASDHSVLMKGNKGDVKGGSTDSGGAPADKREASIRSEESVYTDSNRPPSDKDPRNSERNTGEDCARGNGRNKDMPRGGNNDSGDDSGDDDDGVSDIDRDYLMRDLISISRQTARSRTVLRRASLAMSHHTDLEDREGIRSKDCGAQSHSKSDLDGATFKKQKLLIVKAEEALVSCAVEREEHRGTEREKQEKGKEGKRAAMQMEMEVEAQDYPVRVVYKEARFVIGQKRPILPPSMQVSVPVLMEDKDESEKGDDDGNLNKIEIVHEAKRSDSIGGGNGRGNGEISANTNTSSGCGAKDHRTDRTRIHPQRREISNFLHSCPSFCSYTAPVPISVPAYMSIPRGGVIAPSVATRAFSQQSSDQSSDSFTLPSSSSKSIDNVSEELRSSADIASIISSFNSEFVVATAYNEGLRKIFGNVSALEVAVSLTRNAEIERRGHKKKRNLGESMLSEEDTKNTEVLNALPAFNFAKSCTRVIESMEKSAKKEEEFLFFLRVKSVVDENGFSLSGWQTLITLEGISELSTYTST